MKARLILLCAACLLLLAAGCGAPGAQGHLPTPAEAETPEPAPTPTPDPAAELLAGMSTEQKVGQLLVAGISGGRAGADARAAVADYQVGGVILFGRNVKSAEQLLALTNELKALNTGGIALLLCADQEGGRVSRMPPEVASFPAAYTLRDRPELWSDAGAALGAACAAFGINVNLAPSLDVWSNPKNTVIGDRAYASDWETVATAGTAVMQGIAGAGIVPVVKHFPGHGDTLADSHSELPVVTKSRAELLLQELRPFQAAIDAGADAVMTGHILVQAIDETLPATLSPAVVTGLLRGEMGFDGVVCTDDLTMKAISDTYGMGEAAVLAVEAGCDLLLVCHELENLTEAWGGLLEAVEEGRISAERLDESVMRVLRLKLKYALTDDPAQAPDLAALNGQIARILP